MYGKLGFNNAHILTVKVESGVVTADYVAVDEITPIAAELELHADETIED